MSKTLLIACLTLLSLSACQSGSASEFCLIAQPILPSRADVLTGLTQRQILVHNEKGAALCEWNYH